MSQNDSLVRVGVTGDVYMAPVGTALPTSPTAALNAAFKSVGHLSPDALTESLSLTSERIRTWQKKGGVRTVTTEYDWTFQFVAMETSPLVLEMYYGGADSATVAGTSTTTITSDIGSIQKACVIEIIDGTVVTRYAIPVVDVSDRGDVSHTGGAGTGWDLTVSVTGDATALGYRITNDPTFAALAS
jgi:hypothetical protein